MQGFYSLAFLELFIQLSKLKLFLKHDLFVVMWIVDGIDKPIRVKVYCLRRDYPLLVLYKGPVCTDGHSACQW